MRFCLSCSYPFLSSRRLTTFCGQVCRKIWEQWDAGRRGGGLSTCLECGLPLYRKAGNMRRGRDRYCSHLCAVRSMPRTWIEDALNDVLLELQQELGFEYEEQALVGEKYVVDCWLPALHLAIEANGSFWHATKGSIQSGSNKRLFLLERRISLLEISEEEFSDRDFVLARIRTFVLRVLNVI